MRITAVEAELFYVLLEDAKYQLSDAWHTSYGNVQLKDYRAYFDKIQEKMKAGSVDGRQFTSSCRTNSVSMRDNITREALKLKKSTK